MKLKDLTGQKFGRLTVIRRGEDYISPKGAMSVRWVCRCDCGKEILVGRSSLQSGSYKSCGCYKNSVRCMSYETKSDYVICKCGSGQFLIDISDYEFVKQYGWHISKLGYATENRSKKTLHSMLMNTPKGLYTDHINGNKLDNRRSNLRIVNCSENGYNKKINVGLSGEPFIAYNKNKDYYSVIVDGKYRGGSKNLEQAKQIREKALVGSKVKKYSRFFQE